MASDNSRIAAKIRSAPQSIASDPEVLAVSALSFATRKVNRSIAAASVVAVVFAVLFDGASSIWASGMTDGIGGVGKVLRGYLQGFIVPIAAVASAYFGTRFAIRANERNDLSGRELRRRYLLSDGAVGLIPAVLLSIWITAAGQIVALQDADIDIWKRLDLKRDETLAQTLLIIGVIWLAVGIPNVIAFVRSAKIFRASLGLPPSAGRLVRTLVIWLVSRTILSAALFVLINAIALAAAAPLYWSALRVRETLHLPSAVHSTQVAWFLREQFGAKADVVRPTANASLVEARMYFEFQAQQLDPQQGAELEEFAKQWLDAWRQSGRDLRQSGGFRITSISTSREDSEVPDDRTHATRRANSISYHLAHAGVPPELTTVIVWPDRGTYGLNQGRADMSVDMPEPAVSP
jgi:hypothetical protein